MKLRITLSVRCIALILFLSPIMFCYAQTFSPLELAQEIFSKNSNIDIADYITGEYKGNPNGKDIADNSETRFILLDENKNNAVVTMSIYNTSGYGVDYYLYFKKEIIWKMYAVRSLAMTGMIEAVKNALEQMTIEEVSSMIDMNNDYALFSSIEDYNFLLGNSRLILETDDNIIKHFMENRNKFERIKKFAKKEINNLPGYDNIDMQIDLVKDLEAEYRKLYISSISAGDPELGFCLNFLVGGILDNTVGYIYTIDKTRLPEISPNRIIMIREIGNGWYVYKTT